MIVERCDDVDEDEAPLVASTGVARTIVDSVDAALNEELATPGLLAVLHGDKVDFFVTLVWSVEVDALWLVRIEVEVEDASLCLGALNVVLARPDGFDL